MDVPFRLARREAAAPADAFLLAADGPGPLAAAAARGGWSPETAVFPVAGGFVVVPAGGTPAGVPGPVRLRRLGGDLFVPADADLRPALLPDETVALTRGRGLVVLPGGTVLAFEPDRPLAVASWIAPARVRRRAWEPFPPRPESPDRLTSIRGPAAPAAVAEIIGGLPPGADRLPGAGEEAGDGPPPGDDIRPPAGGAAARGLGAGMLGLGRALVRLGEALGLPGVARAGATLARAALTSAPRLTEKLFGAQEAALREVLRQLQSGHVETALRRAPVAVPDPEKPARLDTGSDLGSCDPRYSLRGLLGGGGTAAAWAGGGDVWGSLAAEYRRLAQEAARRGDFRRAAYLYGVLLRDLRSAANALSAGGLHRDAGVLLREKLRDEPAAAAAFEKAGDYDEALRLYDRLGRHEAAADLLRRLGDEDRAIAYYTRAADEHAAAGRYLAAGDLARRAIGRREVSAGYYGRGWAAGGAEAAACGERLLDEHLVAGDWPAVGRLAIEAGERFRPPRAAEAGRFFNYALRVAEDVLPADLRDDLGDQARLLFADHLRASPGAARADELFGRRWPGPVARDAGFAARAAGRRTDRGPRAIAGPPLPLADGTVTAVAVARDTADLVVATTSAVVVWRAAGGRVDPVCPAGLADILGLSVDPQGTVVYVLSGDGERYSLRSFVAKAGGGFAGTGQHFLGGHGPRGGWHLQPAAWVRAGQSVVTVAAPEFRLQYTGPYLVGEAPRHVRADGGPADLLLAADDGGWEWAGRSVRYTPAGRPPGTGPEWPVHWAPAVPVGCSLAVPRADWVAGRGVLEAAGPDRTGVLHWSEFDARPAAGPASRSARAAHPDRFLAAGLLGPEQVAAVTGRNEVHWFRVSGTQFAPTTAPTPIPVPARAAAVVHRAAANELVVVLEDGSAVRVPRT